MKREERFTKKEVTNKQDTSGSRKPSVTFLVIEEQVKINKKFVETGNLRVNKIVKEHKETIDIPVTNIELKVERRSINEQVSTPPPAIRQEGDTTIISVLEEVMVTEKRLFLVEEVHITRQRVQENHKKEVTLLKEEVNIKRSSNDQNQE